MPDWAQEKEKKKNDGSVGLSCPPACAGGSKRADLVIGKQQENHFIWGQEGRGGLGCAIYLASIIGIRNQTSYFVVNCSKKNQKLSSLQLNHLLCREANGRNFGRTCKTKNCEHQKRTNNMMVSVGDIGNAIKRNKR